MENVIEFGFRFRTDIDNPNYIAKLKKSYDFNHLQIMSSSLDSAEIALKTIGESVDLYDLELSYVMHSSIYDVYQSAESLFSFCRKFKIKYLLVDFDDYLISSDIALYDLMSFIANAGNLSRTFTCLNIRDHINYMTNLNNIVKMKSEMKSDFLLLALDIENLGSSSEFLNRFSYFNECGMLNVKIDNASQGWETNMALLIDKLYWLPWKNKPLVFTNPIEDNFELFFKYNQIIENGNYFYP